MSVENVTFLSEMGFNESVCKQALDISKDNVQEALEWLLVHGNDASSAATAATADNNESSSSKSTLKLSSKLAEESSDQVKDETTTAAADAGANSLKCDDCGLLLKDEDVATLHVNFDFDFYFKFLLNTSSMCPMRISWLGFGYLYSKPKKSSF